MLRKCRQASSPSLCVVSVYKEKTSERDEILELEKKVGRVLDVGLTSISQGAG